MRISHPRTVEDAFDALDEMPDAQLLAGGTDFMVEVNFGHRRPPAVVGLRRVEELGGFELTDDEVVLRAALTWTEVETQLNDELPALAAAARTVGSPQMRNAGTVGGNLGTASPAGDSLPVLAAMDATVVLVSRGGERRLPLSAFITGVKRTAIRPGEIIREVRVPRLRGPQHFLKVGTRNAMVISIACASVVLDTEGRTVRCGLGAVAPTPIRAPEAESFIAGAIDWDGLRAPPEAVARFGELAVAAASPITDHRSTAEYRRHALKVITVRALQRSLAA
ncbi:MAG TPA: FAD binding domain-containing protein [Actinomycetes bacterium]|jgi:CO/xanthine dehydrogenase FAD-binding subunit|nr:FAD binding domain-containing protein [Actinomycetes bacterium]